MTVEITAAVRDHIRNAVRYALMVNPDVSAAELTANLLAEIGNHTDLLCRERDAREAAIPHLRGKAI